jgi:tetratricopeptide (TPR) repeat protein
MFRADSWPRNLAAALLILTCLSVTACSSPEERAQAHYDRGMGLLEKKDYARAGVEFKNALQQKDDMVPAWLGLARVEEHNQKWRQVAGILRKVTEFDPKNIDARVRLARLILLGGDFEGALKLANEAEEIDKKNASVHALKAVILFKLNETGAAVTEARTALKLDPENSSALIVLAAYRLSHADPDGALAALNRNPEVHEKDLGVQLFKLKVLEQIGDKAKSEAVLKKLIEHFPKESGFRKLLVQYYLREDRQDDAEETIRAVTNIDPANSDAKLDVVRFLLGVKGPDTARQELTSLIEAGGDVYPYQMALAELDYTRGRVSESLALLKKLGQSENADQALKAKIKLAEQHLDQKNYDAAKAIAAEILSQDARNVGGLRLRASTHIAANNYEEAIADLREALNEQPGSAQLLRLLAIAYERNGAIELADEAFGKATREAANNPTIALEYAAFLQRRGRPERAEDLIMELASRNPRNPRVLAAVAQVKLARQDWEGARKVAQALRKAGTSKSLADTISAEALAGQGRNDLSISILEGAYSETPNAAQPMARLVRAYVRAKQPEKAESFLQSVLEANPSSAEARILLGSLELQKGEQEKALESFKEAVAKQPNEPGGYLALSDYYVKQKAYDEAMKALEAGLEKQSKNFALRLAKAGVDTLQDDYEAAIALYEELLQEQPGSLVITNNLASLLSDHRDDPASLERAQSLAANLQQMNVPQFKDTLGWIHYRQGDFRSAIPLLEEAQQALPNLAVVRYHLGMSYLAADQTKKATEQLKKALELLPSSGGMAEEDIQAALSKANPESSVN